MTKSAAAVEALFFDFDGVILDSVTAKEEVFEAIIRRRAPEQVDAVMQYYWANGGVSRLKKFRYIWENILQKPLDNGGLEELGREFSQGVFNRVVHCSFVGGAEEFLREHSSDWPCFVISGTPEPELRAIVAARGLENHFRGVFGSPATKVEIGRRILQDYGYEPNRVWFVGDATTEREAASALGVRFVGLAGPHLTPFLTGGETTIKDLSELYPLLSSRNPF